MANRLRRHPRAVDPRTAKPQASRSMARPKEIPRRLLAPPPHGLPIQRPHPPRRRAHHLVVHHHRDPHPTRRHHPRPRRLRLVPYVVILSGAKDPRISLLPLPVLSSPPHLNKLREK